MEATRADAVPAVFTKVHMAFTVVGDVPIEKAEEAVRLSVEKYCSVSRMIGSTAKITTEVKIEAE
jgi:putative redox protein